MLHVSIITSKVYCFFKRGAPSPLEAVLEKVVDGCGEGGKASGTQSHGLWTIYSINNSG